MNMFIVLNALFMVMCWKFATIDFKHGNNKMGWLNIFFSAWNAAALADKLF
jgi:hypothetical protein